MIRILIHFLALALSIPIVRLPIYTGIAYYRIAIQLSEHLVEKGIRVELEVAMSQRVYLSRRLLSFKLREVKFAIHQNMRPRATRTVFK